MDRNQRNISRTKKNKVKKRWVVIISFIVFLLFASIGVFIYVTNMYNHKEIDKGNLGIHDDLNDNQINETITTIDEEGNEVEQDIVVDISGIKNIALFGLDRRTSDETTTRSDSIMVATINFDTDEIKLTSFMRDMLVDIEGHGKDKLNHAYAYGGPELSIKTLNQNFGLNITDYVAVDFLMLEEIIDVFDGIEIEVEPEEAELMNQYMEEVAVKNNKSFDKITESGLVNLTGAQAVAFARIRYFGNGDYERTERQRIVLSAILEKASDISIKNVPSLATSLLSNMETSIGEFSAINMGKNYLLGDFDSPKTERIPRDGSFTAGIGSNGLWSMNVNFEKENEFLKGWIFNVDTQEYLKYKEKHETTSMKDESIEEEPEEQKLEMNHDLNLGNYKYATLKLYNL